MLRFPRKKSKKSPIAIGVGTALAMGGLVSAYLRWLKPRGSKAGRAPKPKGSTGVPEEEVNQLASHWHSLDAETASGHIPRDLERKPKNFDQAHHPGP